MNLQERLEQCKEDIEILEQQKRELEKHIENEKFELGDIVEVKGYGDRRVILYEPISKVLKAFGKDGSVKGGLAVDQYRKTGENIFKNNKFCLDN